MCTEYVYIHTFNHVYIWYTLGEYLWNCHKRVRKSRGVVFGESSVNRAGKFRFGFTKRIVVVGKGCRHKVGDTRVSKSHSGDGSDEFSDFGVHLWLDTGKGNFGLKILMHILLQQWWNSLVPSCLFDGILGICDSFQQTEGWKRQIFGGW